MWNILTLKPVQFIEKKGEEGSGTFGRKMKEKKKKFI